MLRVSMQAAKRCCTSEGLEVAGGGSGQASDTAAIVGMATSKTLCHVRSLSRVMEASAEASTILAGNLWRKSSRRKVFVSAVPSLSPRSCCILLSSWVGFLSPSSSPLINCCNFLCSEAAVRLMSCALRVSYGLSAGGFRRRSLTSMANSGLRELLTCWNLVF